MFRKSYLDLSVFYNDSFNRYLINVMSERPKNIPETGPEDLKWLDLVVEQVRSLRFGVVEIIVHDSRVIQIEKTEKLRLEKSPTDKR